VARAEAALAADDLATAGAAIDVLPPEIKAPATPWLEEAQARLALDRVVAQLTAAAGAPRP